MEDAWDWVQEELKKIQQDVPPDTETMQVVDAISVADFWKRRYDEELMLWERRLESKEDEKRVLQGKAQMHEASIKEMEWKLRELERRWDQEKLLLEDRIKSKEVESELERTRYQWETRMRALEEENKGLKTHLQRMEGVAFAPPVAAPVFPASPYPPAAPAAPAAGAAPAPAPAPAVMPPAGSMSSKELEQVRQQMEKRLKEREDQLRRSEEEVRQRLESLETEKKNVEQTLVDKEKQLQQEKEQYMKADKDVSTTSVQMTQQLTHLKERETEHFVILEDLARGFAHRVRNYLGIMSGTVQLCIANFKMDAELEEQLKIVDQNVQDMLKSIEDFLGLARIPEMYFQPLNFNQVFDAIAQTMAPKLKAQNVTFATQYDAALPAYKGDPKLFDDALQQLVQNSIEALPQGGQITVTTLFDKNRDAVVLKINDNGGGIADNHIKKIFQPYFTSKKNHKGLGLTIAKRVVDLHRGTLQVESAKGKGTTIVISLFMPAE
jgi:signal transduction histidine kinase